MTLTDQGGGKWKVDQDQPLSFALKVDGEVDMKVSIGGIKGTGIFDEALGAMESSVTDYQPIRLRPDDHRARQQHRRSPTRLPPCTMKRR